ncbi:MAG: hypothetical protein PHQ75_05320, partial [Thermoguttaceae bacterium]|nr:hypothetical protein [Thermoguttaceae bacterium]
MSHWQEIKTNRDGRESGSRVTPVLERNTNITALPEYIFVPHMIYSDINDILSQYQSPRIPKKHPRMRFFTNPVLPKRGFWPYNKYKTGVRKALVSQYDLEQAIVRITVPSVPGKRPNGESSMKRLAVSLFGILIAFCAILLCTTALWAQQDKPANKPAEKPAVAPKAPSAPSTPGQAKHDDKAAPETKSKKPQAKSDSTNSGKKAEDTPTGKSGKKSPAASNKAVSTDQADDPFAHNTADQLLNMAADAKLIAKSPRDLNRVIDLCKA